MKDENAPKYDASKEDIYALGIVLYSMLTCSLPYDSPFYLDKDGYLNGNKSFKIDNLETNEIITNDILDENFKYLHENGVEYLLNMNCSLDYVNNDSLDLLNKIFSKRMTLKELINHPFVQKPPNARLFPAILKHAIAFNRNKYEESKENIKNQMKKIDEIYNNRLNIEAKLNMCLLSNNGDIIGDDEHKEMSETTSLSPIIIIV